MKDGHRRYKILDSIRGFTLFNMIFYHMIWDLVYLFGYSLPWYQGRIGDIWQQSICWSFILLSGFCWSLGKRKWKRGLLTLGAGAAITIVTLLFLPEQRILFGILTFMGSSTLLLIPLERVVCRIPPAVGILCSFLVFAFLKHITLGYAGFSWLYRNLGSAYLGFPPDDFYSADYFPLLPWFFLYICGYFLYRWIENKGWLPFLEREIQEVFFQFLGKHSLLIYMFHQPVIYVVLMIVL